MDPTGPAAKSDSPARGCHRLTGKFAAELNSYDPSVKEQVLHKVGLLQSDPAPPNLTICPVSVAME